MGGVLRAWRRTIKSNGPVRAHVLRTTVGQRELSRYTPPAPYVAEVLAGLSPGIPVAFLPRSYTRYRRQGPGNVGTLGYPGIVSLEWVPKCRLEVKALRHSEV